jgi:hypothetical protein
MSSSSSITAISDAGGEFASSDSGSREASGSLPPTPTESRVLDEVPAEQSITTLPFADAKMIVGRSARREQGRELKQPIQQKCLTSIRMIAQRR